MKVSVEDRQGLFKSLQVEVEGDIVRSALDEVYTYLRENVQIEGFRKGKAPLWIIKSRFREYIQEEVGKKVANATLADAIKESGLKPVADIYLEEVSLEEASNRLRYSVSFEVPPEFELQPVEGLEVEIRKVEYSDQLLRERLRELQEEHALWLPVEREIREGDLVVVDYKVEELETGESTEGETSGIIGTKTFREEIERELIGKKEGDRFVLEDLTLYDTEGNPAGKARVEITVKSVKEKVLPELNDDFARELGLGQTWAEAEEKIKEELKAGLENLKKTLITDAVAKKLVQMHDFQVPQTLLQRELSQLVEIRVRELAQWGIDPRYVDYRALAQELAPRAIFNIKLRFILDRYAQEKGIQVSEEELRQRINAMAQAYERSPEEMKEFLERENLLTLLEEDIRREKALEDIVSKAVIKEVEEQKEEKNEAV